MANVIPNAKLYTKIGTDSRVRKKSTGLASCCSVVTPREVAKSMNRKRRIQKPRMNRNPPTNTAIRLQKAVSYT